MNALNINHFTQWISRSIALAGFVTMAAAAAPSLAAPNVKGRWEADMMTYGKPAIKESVVLNITYQSPDDKYSRAAIRGTLTKEGITYPIVGTVYPAGAITIAVKVFGKNDGLNMRLQYSETTFRAFVSRWLDGKWEHIVYTPSWKQMETGEFHGGL